MATYVKFNIVKELNKTLRGQTSKVDPLTLLHCIGPAYLERAASKSESKEQEQNGA